MRGAALRLALVGALLVVAAPAPAPARAAGRLDVLARELRERPVAVDPELSWYFTRADAARLERALRKIPLDVYVAVLPLLDDDESGGDGERVADGLHRRVKRRGLYVTIDEDGYIRPRAYRVPREIFVGYGIEDTFVRDRPDASEVIGRVQRFVSKIAAAKPADTTDEASLRPLEPYGYLRPYDPDESTRQAALASGIIGAMLGLIGGGFARRKARRDAARAAAQTRDRGHRRGRRGRRGG